MNTIRKLKKNAKALSPVVASIILIAVTVAVSIAVAVWMGALSTGFMQTEQISITNVVFSGTATINMTISNSGIANVTISYAAVNNNEATIASGSLLVANTPANTLVLTMAENWVLGNTYQIKLTSQKGNVYTYQAVAS
jgi:flagellin-like protein